jgi:hypothetical protein
VLGAIAQTGASRMTITAATGATATRHETERDREGLPARVIREIRDQIASFAVPDRPSGSVGRPLPFLCVPP